jgi:hypothetical protein
MSDIERLKANDPRIGLGLDLHKESNATNTAQTFGGNIPGSFNPYNKYNDGYVGYDLNQVRSHNQSNWNRFGYVALNFAPNFLIGLGEAVGSLGYLFSGFNSDYGKAMAAMTALRNPFTSDEFMLNYKNPGKEYDMSDASTYFSMGSSLVESVASFAVAGMGMAKVAQLGGKAAAWGAAKLGGNALNTARYVEQGMQAALMSYSEGTGIGAQVFKQGLTAYSKPIVDKIFKDKLAQAKLQYGEEVQLPDGYIKQLHEEATKEGLAQTQAMYGDELAKAAWTTTAFNTMIGAPLNWTSAGLFLKGGTKGIKGTVLQDGVRTHLSNIMAGVKDASEGALRLAKVTPELLKHNAFKAYLLEGGQEFLEESAMNNTAQWLGEKHLGLNKESWAEMQFSSKSFIDGTLGFIGGFGQTALTGLATKYTDGKRTGADSEVKGNLGYMTRDAYNDALYNNATVAQLNNLKSNITTIASTLTTVESLKQQRDKAKTPAEKNNLSNLIDDTLNDLTTLTKLDSVRNGNGEYLTAFYQKIADTDNTKIIEEPDINGNPQTEAMKMGLAENMQDNLYREKAVKAVSGINEATKRWNDYQRKYNLDGYDYTGYADTLLSNDLLQNDLENRRDETQKSISELESEVDKILKNGNKLEAKPYVQLETEIKSKNQAIQLLDAQLKALEDQHATQLKVYDSKGEDEDAKFQKAEQIKLYNAKKEFLNNSITSLQSSISDSENTRSDVLNSILMSDKTYSDIELKNIEANGKIAISEAEIEAESKNLGKFTKNAVGETVIDEELNKSAQAKIDKAKQVILDNKTLVAINEQKQKAIAAKKKVELETTYKNFGEVISNITEGKASVDNVNNRIKELQEYTDKLLSDEGRASYRANWLAHKEHIAGLYEKYVKDTTPVETKPEAPKAETKPEEAPKSGGSTTTTTASTKPADVKPEKKSDETVSNEILNKILTKIKGDKKNSIFINSRLLNKEAFNLKLSHGGLAVAMSLDEHLNWAYKVLADSYIVDTASGASLVLDAKGQPMIASKSAQSKEVEAALDILENHIKYFFDNINTLYSLGITDKSANVVKTLNDIFTDLVSGKDTYDETYESIAIALGIIPVGDTNGYTISNIFTKTLDLFKPTQEQELKVGTAIGKIYPAYMVQLDYLNKLILTINTFRNKVAKDTTEQPKDKTEPIEPEEETGEEKDSNAIDYGEVLFNNVVKVGIVSLEDFLNKPYSFYTNLYQSYLTDRDFMKLNHKLSKENMDNLINFLGQEDNQRVVNAYLAQILKENGYEFLTVPSTEFDENFFKQGESDMFNLAQLAEKDNTIPEWAIKNFEAIQGLEEGSILEISYVGTPVDNDLQLIGDKSDNKKAYNATDIIYRDSKTKRIVGVSASVQHIDAILAIAESMQNLIVDGNDAELIKIRDYLAKLTTFFGTKSENIANNKTKTNVAKELLSKGTITVGGVTSQLLDAKTLEAISKYYTAEDYMTIFDHIRKVLNYKNDKVRIQDNLIQWANKLRNDLTVLAKLRQQLDTKNKVKVVVTRLVNGSVKRGKEERKLNKLITPPTFEEAQSSDVGFVRYRDGGWKYIVNTPGDNNIRTSFADNLPEEVTKGMTAYPRLIVNMPINKNTKYGQLVATEIELKELSKQSIERVSDIFTRLTTFIKQQLANGSSLAQVTTLDDYRLLTAELERYIHKEYGGKYTYSFDKSDTTRGNLILQPETKTGVKYNYTIVDGVLQPVDHANKLDAIVSKYKRHIDYDLMAENKEYYDSIWDSDDIVTRVVPLMMNGEIVALSHGTADVPFKIYTTPLDETSNNSNNDESWQKQQVSQSPKEANANEQVDMGVVDDTTPLVDKRTAFLNKLGGWYSISEETEAYLVNEQGEYLNVSTGNKHGTFSKTKIPDTRLTETDNESGRFEDILTSWSKYHKGLKLEIVTRWEDVILNRSTGTTTLEQQLPSSSSLTGGEMSTESTNSNDTSIKTIETSNNTPFNMIGINRIQTSARSLDVTNVIQIEHISQQLYSLIMEQQPLGELSNLIESFLIKASTFITKPFDVIDIIQLVDTVEYKNLQEYLTKIPPQASTPTLDLGLLADENNSIVYQLPNTTDMVASEKTLRDLAARLSHRIGMPVKFESDRSKEYKGKIEHGTAFINLAYATLDTPIHEILGHPIIRVIKNGVTTTTPEYLEESDADRVIEPGQSFEKNGLIYKYELDAPNGTRLFRYDHTTYKGENIQLYQNLLKELETGRGKEVLDRIKRDYQYKSPEQLGYNQDWLNQTEEYPNSIKPTQEEINSRKEKAKYSLEEQQEEAIVELLGLMTAEKLDNVKDGKLISLLKRLLKEIKSFVRSLLKQREVEIDKLPDNMTLGDLSDLLAYSNSKLILPGYEVEYTTPDNNKFTNYSEASTHISKLAKNVKDVDLSSITINNELSDKDKLDIKNLRTTIADITNYITSSDYLINKEKEISRLSSEIKTIETTPQVLTTQEPTVAYEDKLKYDVGDYEYARVESTYSRPEIYDTTKYGYESYLEHRNTLGDNYEGYYIHAYSTQAAKPYKQIIPITRQQAEDIFNKAGIDKFTVKDRQILLHLKSELKVIERDGKFQSKIDTAMNDIKNIINGSSTIKGFIEKNKEYEQAKEVIEEWKKVNNIQYNPEEVYSRGQEFTSVVGAYSTFDINLMMQNLLTHIEDNEKAGGKFAISAYTKPIGISIPHMDGGGGKVKFNIYPKSEDILWAADTDVYSGSVWDASEKVNKDKKSEILGVSYTKYPAIANINRIQPNLANIIDKLSGHHNELGIVLTGNNFRLTYDDNIPYHTKQLIDNINSILDGKYGKLNKPNINELSNKISDKLKAFKLEVETLLNTNKINHIEALKMIDAFRDIESGIIQPTQTVDTLIENINSVKSRTPGKLEGTPDFIDRHITKEEYESKIVSRTEEVNRNYWKNIPSFLEHATEENTQYRYFDEKGNVYFRNVTTNTYSKRVEKEDKVYTNQALINTKIAALKEVAKKYPRSLIRSEVKPIAANYQQFDAELDLPFQKVSSTTQDYTQQELEEQRKHCKKQ